MNPVLTEFLETAATRKYVYTFNGVVHEVEACVYTCAESGFGFLDFYREHRKRFEHEKVSWFFHMRLLSQRYTVEEYRLALGLKLPLPTMVAAFDYWLIADRSLECQLSLLDTFHYSDGTPAKERRLKDCKRLLKKIAEHQSFTIYTITEDGTAGLSFDNKPNAKSIRPFFDDLVTFMKTHDRLEFSVKTLRDTVYGGSVVL